MIITKKHIDILSLFSGVLFFLTLLACDDSSESSITGNRAKPAAHRVDVVSVENKSVYLKQTVSGTIEAVTQIRLYNEESGRITMLPYHEGDFVKKGSLLVQLDNELLKTDVAKATASREQAEVDLSRVKKLLPKKISTEEEVAKAQTILDLAIAEEKRQLTRLRRTSIRAPIDGIISERFYEPGDLLAAQSHIHTIVDPSALRLKASLAERWIPLVAVNQPVTMRIDALGDKPLDARIVRIHPTINASTHKGIIEIQLDPVPDGARVGQFARAEIELKASDRLVIPVHTILYEPEGAYVFRVMETGPAENGNGKTTVEKVFFEQGQQLASLVEVLTNLKPGDKIVSRGYLGLRDGKQVIISNADASISPAIKPDIKIP